MIVETIWEWLNALGEGPMWHPQEKVLYWIDIAMPSLHQLDPVTRDDQNLKMPDFIGAAVPRNKGGLVITLGNAILAVETPSMKMTKLAAIEPWSNELRMNDGKCDRAGCFWIGVANLDIQNPKGGLYRLDPDGKLTKMEEGITISNGLAFSPDNKIFYYTDGLKYCIYQYDFNLKKGAISKTCPFNDLPVAFLVARP